MPGPAIVPSKVVLLYESPVESVTLLSTTWPLPDNVCKRHRALLQIKRDPVVDLDVFAEDAGAAGLVGAAVVTTTQPPPAAAAWMVRDLGETVDANRAGVHPGASGSGSAIDPDRPCQRTSA